MECACIVRVLKNHSKKLDFGICGCPRNIDSISTVHTIARAIQNHGKQRGLDFVVGGALEQRRQRLKELADHLPARFYG